MPNPEAYRSRKSQLAHDFRRKTKVEELPTLLLGPWPMLGDLHEKFSDWASIPGYEDRTNAKASVNTRRGSR